MSIGFYLICLFFSFPASMEGLMQKQVEDMDAMWSLLKGSILSKEPIQRNRIKLDVGGTTFSTSITTLTSVKDSFFEKMFSERWVQPEPDGTFFIDRNPAVFHHILEHLRTQQLPKLSTLSEEEQELLKKDASFYMLPNLEKMFGGTQKTHSFGHGGFRRGMGYVLKSNNMVISVPKQNQPDDSLIILSENSLPKGNTSWAIELTSYNCK